MASPGKTVGRFAGTATKARKKAGKESAPKKSAKRTFAPAANLYTVPPVIGKGKFTQAQISRAVATALQGKTFEADD